MSDARTRQAYVSILSRYAEQNFRDRLTALGRQPRVPIPVMARAFVGSALAILEAWLAGDEQIPAMLASCSSPAEPGRMDCALVNSDTQPGPRQMPAHRRHRPQSHDPAVLSLPVPPRPTPPLENPTYRDAL